jgi:hypothetical protein
MLILFENFTLLFQGSYRLGGWGRGCSLNDILAILDTSNFKIDPNNAFLVTYGAYVV